MSLAIFNVLSIQVKKGSRKQQWEYYNTKIKETQKRSQLISITKKKIIKPFENAFKNIIQLERPKNVF